jgi:hypothetical protein
MLMGPIWVFQTVRSWTRKLAKLWWLFEIIKSEAFMTQD